MPLLHHAMFGTFGRDRQPIQLTRKPYREIADVDHLLHFTEAFLQYFSGLDGDQSAERIFVGAQLLTQQADQFAALGRRNIAPL